MSEMRWNPMLGEWVVTATHRQGRTFLPPADFCPLCPTRPGGFPTEVPDPDYDIVVFENRFPSFSSAPPEPAIAGTELYPVEPAAGVCEVVLYSPVHDTTLAAQPVEQIHKLVQVWADRTVELGQRDDVRYVFAFENKGVQIGVTLHHPHGQIYGYPFVPPRIRTELEQARAHREKTGRCLFCDILGEERKDGRRVVAQNDSFVAYIPFFARWPYEVHISAVRHVQALPQLEPKELRDLAELLKGTLVAFDQVFQASFPYMMVLHQQPTDGARYDHYHFHIEFYPPLRTKDRLKYLAGSETGAGLFINDTLPEEKAAELRALYQPVRWAAP